MSSLHNGVTEKTSSSSLRILTDEPSVEFISEALGVTPTAAHLKGERRSMRNPRSALFEQSLWIYEAPLPDSAELHEHIEWILTFLEGKAEALHRIRPRIVAIDIFCMFSSEHGQGAAELSAELIGRLAHQHIDLVIDLYPPN
jgi:hypothetical protein